MSKKNLIKSIAEVNGFTQSQAETSIDTVLAGLAASLQEHSEVRLSGFGTFKIVTKKARVVRHPTTGKTMTLPARRTVKFIPSPALDEGV